MNILDSTLSLLFLFLSVQTRNGNSRLVLSFPVACERSRTRGTSWKTREHGSGPAGVSAGSVPRVTSHRGRLLQLGTRNGRSKRPALLVRGPVRSGAKSRVACVTLALLPRWVERPETFAGARLPLAVSATGTDASYAGPGAVARPGVVRRTAGSQRPPAPVSRGASAAAVRKGSVGRRLSRAGRFSRLRVGALPWPRRKLPSAAGRLRAAPRPCAAGSPVTPVLPPHEGRAHGVWRLESRRLVRRPPDGDPRPSTPPPLRPVKAEFSVAEKRSKRQRDGRR